MQHNWQTHFMLHSFYLSAIIAIPVNIAGSLTADILPNEFEISELCLQDWSYKGH